VREARPAITVKRLPEFAILLPALALVSILLALWGWGDHARALGLSSTDILYRSLGAVGISSLYETSRTWFGDWRLDLARMLGAVAFFLTITSALTSLLREQLRELAARWRRGHLIVIGDHAVARAIVEAGVRRRIRVTWIVGEGAKPEPMARTIAVARRWDEASAVDFGAMHASQAVVALGDEVEQIAVVRMLRAAVPALPITMNISDPWFADRLDAIENISNVRYVSLAGISVRQLHDRSPPFLVAQRLGHARLHALIVGCGRTGEATLHDLLLSQLTSFLGKPRITIVDPRAAEIAASVLQRAPELARSAEIHFVRPDHATDVRAIPAAELARAHGDCPFTLAYVALDGDLRTMGLGVSLQALARREGWHLGPIYTRLAAYGAFPNLTASRAGGDAAELIAWGDTRDFAEELGLFDGQADAMARAFHDAYARAGPERAGTVLPWEALGEEARQSNRHLLVHVPAKLASIGVDVAAWLCAAADGPGGRAPPPIPELGARPELVERLAALEHARWATERRLCGWQHGDSRDNARRLHPGLVAWDALPEGDRAFNRAMVVAIVEASAKAA